MKDSYLKQLEDKDAHLNMILEDKDHLTKENSSLITLLD